MSSIKEEDERAGCDRFRRRRGGCSWVEDIRFGEGRQVVDNEYSLANGDLRNSVEEDEGDATRWGDVL